ncbi:DUF4124 domain-containing protein [Halomonas campaniensis]|uniref:DUF4124 domain-containing protein n=1 Tax=Halomonas campaniensis TaxID=213554 RepID=UPI003CCC9945
MIRSVLLTAILLLPLTAEAQVYRCEVDGRTTFQDAPCGDGTGSVRRDSLSTYQAPPSHQRPLQRSRPPRSSPQSPARAPQQQRLPNAPEVGYIDRADQRNNITRARARGLLAIGMTEAQTIQVLGHPHNHNTQRFNNKTCKTYFWTNPRFSPGRHVATLCDGEVVRYSGPRR